MVVRNEQQALTVAVEMEKRVIRIYERALMIADDLQVKQGIRDIIQEENEHLQRFYEMKAACPALSEQEDRLLIQAISAEILFPGGVMELERATGLDTLEGLYRFAAESEYDAMIKFADYADKCESQDVREAFLSIAREEAVHYARLKEKVDEAAASAANVEGRKPPRAWGGFSFAGDRLWITCASPAPQKNLPDAPNMPGRFCHA